MQKLYFFLLCILFFSFAQAQPITCKHTQSFAYEAGNAIAVTNDGGCIIAGITAEYGLGIQGNAYLLKLDSNYNIQWGKTFENTFQSELYDVAQTYDGGYIAAGSFQNATSIPHILIIKTDAAGTLVWQQTLGTIGNDHAYVIKQTPDSGYVAVGHT